MAQDRAVVNTAMNLQVTSNAGKLATRLETVSFSRRTLLNGIL
jgi:hypothetical protein